MLRVFVLILTFIYTISFVVIPAYAGRIKPVKWFPIVGLVSPGSRAYLDLNSFETIVIDQNNKFNSAEILISYDESTDVMVNGTKYTVRSMIRHLVIDCSSALLAPVYDIYFTEAIPTRESTPLSGVQWPTDVKQTARIISKQSTMYSTLCPIYI